MVPDPEFQTQTEASDTPISDHPARPARRSGRGRRGRGRRRKQKPAAAQAARAEVPEAPRSDEPVDALHDAPGETEPPVNPEAEDSTEVSHVPSEPEVHEEVPRRPMSAPPPARPSHPAPRPTVQQAIEEVNQIMVSLKETQDLMEEVLEMLEQFERQGNADAHEIDSLRRALRHLQRPRDGAHPQRGRP